MPELLGFTHEYVPAADGAPPYTLLLLHGTGGDERDLLPLGKQAAPGARLLSPRGRVLEQGMPRFFRRLAPGVFDLKDLEVRTHELADFVTGAAAHYGFDPGTVIALGYSNGANIAASLLLLRPGTLAGAALLRPMVPLVARELPRLDGTPVLLAGGRRDPIVPPEETARLADLLEECGAQVTTRWAPRGHDLGAEELTDVESWLGGVTLVV